MKGEAGGCAGEEKKKIKGQTEGGGVFLASKASEQRERRCRVESESLVEFLRGGIVWVEITANAKVLMLARRHYSKSKHS